MTSSRASLQTAVVCEIKGARDPSVLSYNRSSRTEARGRVLKCKEQRLSERFGEGDRA